MMNGVLIFCGILGIIMLGLIIVFLNRNNQTFKMREEINHLCWNWGNKNLDKLVSGEETSAYEWIYNKLPDYDEMLFSRRPLKKEYWIHEEDLKKLLDGATK